MGVLDTITIDFFVLPVYDPKVLVISDNSNWLTIATNPSTIEITLPGSTIPRIFTFVKLDTNTFDSHTLGLTCLSGDCVDEEYVYLPDGIYTITVKGNTSVAGTTTTTTTTASGTTTTAGPITTTTTAAPGVTYATTKTYLKTDSLNQRLDKILIDTGFTIVSGDKRVRDNVLDIKIILSIADAQARGGDIIEAKRYYDIASSEVTKLENCI